MSTKSITRALLLIIIASAICNSWQVEAFSSIITSSTTSSLCSRTHRQCVQKRRSTTIQPTTKTQSSLSTASFRLYQGLSNNDGTIDSSSVPLSCWNPNLRKTIATISSLGILETAYLTYDKLQFASNGGVGENAASLVSALCSSNGSGGGGGASCNDVLHGPYASLHIGTIDIPLSLLGMMAYTIAFSLATLPLVFNEEKNHNSVGEVEVVPDGQNRIALLGVTTLMASFSVYLVSLLVGVLHASCVFCFASAGLSLSMAGLAWFSGMLPGSSTDVQVVEGEELLDSNVLVDISELRKSGMTVGASSVGLATVMALGIFLTVDDVSAMPSGAGSSSSGTLLASTSKSAAMVENAPPAITTTSSKAALALASDLKSLDARMFGAFWCSHCYDQKQALGYEAMQSIPYIECDREGANSQRDFCKEKDVPGYPTWEIGGKLFPGERSVEELREMVDEVMSWK